MYAEQLFSPSILYLFRWSVLSLATWAKLPDTCFWGSTTTIGIETCAAVWGTIAQLNIEVNFTVPKPALESKSLLLISHC